MIKRLRDIERTIERERQRERERKREGKREKSAFAFQWPKFYHIIEILSRTH